MRLTYSMPTFHHIMQYFPRSHFAIGSRPAFALSVIILCLLQLSFPICTSATKNTNDGTIDSKLSSSKSVNNVKESSSSVPISNEVDIVGFGEDCSSEGPFCDKRRHLSCDPIDETCICDVKNGYVHINDVPGGIEQHFLIQYDENGKPFYDPAGNVCISKQEIIDRTDKLLGLSGSRRLPDDDYSPAQDDQDLEYDVSNEANGKNDILSDPEMDPTGSGDMNPVYEKFMKLANAMKQPGYAEERLERFKLNRKIANSHMTEKELIIDEILKYRRGTEVSLVELKPFLKDLLDLHLNWRTKKISNSICSRIFDVDRDEVFTHEEYAIVLLSENLRELVIPKVFLNLIGPLMEESCISMEDLQALDHDPDTLYLNFYIMDDNEDGCFSQDEFWKYANETCWVNWLTDFLRRTDLQVFLEIIDPTPEEMYIRRIMQNERLSTNWKIVDKDKDGYLSSEELHFDLSQFVLSLEDTETDAEKLMMRLDKNKDGRVSLAEVKFQMTLPDLTEEHHVEWLESLYELYDTDEDEVKEYLEVLNENYNEHLIEKSIEEFASMLTSNETGANRLFTIFDRNRNGEMEKTEFKLLMEVIKKYVVHGLLNDTIDPMDMNFDRKLSIFEYQEFFRNTSATFRIYFKNLLALEDELEDLENGEEDSVEDDGYDEEAHESDDSETEETAEAVSSTKLSKRAAASNESLMVYKLFTRLDANSDGFITKEDFYSYASSYKAKKTVSELQEEFTQLDVDNDGVLTTKDSEEYAIPLDFAKFKELSDAFSEEVFPSHLKAEFALIDRDLSGIVEKEEFQKYKAFLFNSEEETEFLNWVEDYLAKIPTQIDEGNEKAFAEFDTNRDKFISKTEFEAQLEELQRKSERIGNIRTNLMEDVAHYFESLDLNKDDKVSVNEFQLLLLRPGNETKCEMILDYAHLFMYSL